MNAYQLHSLKLHVVPNEWRPNDFPKRMCPQKSRIAMGS